MTDECDGSSLNRENGYAKLKKNKNKVKASPNCTQFANFLGTYSRVEMSKGYPGPFQKATSKIEVFLSLPV